MMPFLKEIKRGAHFLLIPMLGFGVFVYFSYHTIQGKRGLLAWWETRHEIRQAQVRLGLLRREHDALVNRVRLLRPESLDPDLLEERAWAVLGMGMKGDLVVVTSVEPPPSVVR